MENIFPPWVLIFIAAIIVLLITGWKVLSPVFVIDSRSLCALQFPLAKSTSPKPFLQENHSPQSQGSFGTSSLSKEKKNSSKPLSEEAQIFSSSFGLRRNSTITVFVNDVIFRRINGQWSPIDSALKALALLEQVCPVYLVAWVESDEEEREVQCLAKSSGLIAINSAATEGVPEHRFLFCSSHVGLVAVIRQLRSHLHIGGSTVLLDEVAPFVPVLVHTGESSVSDSAFMKSHFTESAGGEPSKAKRWKEFRSLADLARVGDTGGAAEQEDLSLAVTATGQQGNSQGT
ncbi:unnamed protein product [Choristocarpus tenellus]